MATMAGRTAKEIHSPPFAYEKIKSPDPSRRDWYRVHDARDNALATCGLEENAGLVVEALNALYARGSCG